MYAQNSESCPHCGEDVANLTNHIRMSSGGGHGPQGRYPDAGDDAPEVELREEPADVDDVDQEDGDDQELAELEIVDTRAEASEYECAECGATLGYHQDPCECGENPMWRAPVA